jgi:2-dehydropantoate 2-reductase
MDSIAILGPGGVGGFLAAALSRAGQPVTIVARDSTARQISAGGIEVRSARLGEFSVRPRAVVELRSTPDVLLVATKATGLAPALDRIQAAPDLVVPLLNGLDHMDTLRDRYGAHRVAAGTIRIESDRPAPGVVVQNSQFLRVDLASSRPSLLPGLDELAQALEQAEVPTTVSSNEAQILWSKLVRLNALALTTSAIDRPIGFIRTDPEWREALRLCIEETSAVARADGARLDAAATLAELDEAHAELGSSMQRDIAAGREPELDAIAGSVLRAGQRHGIDCPTIARLAATVAQRACVTAPGAAARSTAAG